MSGCSRQFKSESNVIRLINHLLDSSIDIYGFIAISWWYYSLFQKFFANFKIHIAMSWNLNFLICFGAIHKLILTDVERLQKNNYIFVKY